MRKDIKNFIAKMSQHWGADTSYFNDDREPRCAGQCACSALLLQEKFGGEIKRVIIGDTRHYFNVIDGVIVDSTASQYLIDKGIDYSTATNPPDDFPHSETIEKYKLLKNKMIHADFINIAIDFMKDTVANGGMPFGAIVVRDGIVVGKSNVPRAEFDPTAHAEVTAIRDACKNLKTYNLSGCIIYSSCKPCSMCVGAIKWAGITDSYYAMDKSDAQSIGYLDDIFLDDTIRLSEHKIDTPELNEYMKDWYDKNTKA